jgi:18S rRNA (guanine1575-N7)-methyltransferase
MLRLVPAVVQVEGDVLLGDMGQGVPLRQGCFDGAISISAVQWLCNADRSSHEPRKRLKAFFESLYRCLARGARAVLQVGAPAVAGVQRWPCYRM